MVTVFFDGVCSLCSREIAHYRKIAPKGKFRWIDVTQRSEAKQLAAYGISLSDALKVLHVVDSNGKIHRGVSSFEIIWEQLPRWHIMAFFMKFKIVKSITSILYMKFAERRFSRSSHCKLLLQKP